MAIRRSRRSPPVVGLHFTLTAAASARTDSVSAIIAQGPARPQFLRIPHCSGFRREVLPVRNCIAVSRPLDCFTSLRHRYGAQGEQRYHRSDRELVHVCSRGIGNSRVRSRRKNGDPSGCLPNAKPIGPAAQSSRLVHALVQFPNSCSPAVYCDELDGRAQTINSSSRMRNLRTVNSSRVCRSSQRASSIKPVPEEEVVVAASSALAYVGAGITALTADDDLLTACPAPGNAMLIRTSPTRLGSYSVAVTAGVGSGNAPVLGGLMAAGAT